jgi:hypothetical protein
MESDSTAHKAEASRAAPLRSRIKGSWYLSTPLNAARIKLYARVMRTTPRPGFSTFSRVMGGNVSR